MKFIASDNRKVVRSGNKSSSLHRALLCEFFSSYYDTVRNEIA